jgi:hypothetical protein
MIYDKWYGTDVFDGNDADFSENAKILKYLATFGPI